MSNWDKRFLELATLIATWSKDPSTKVGAVIVGAEREVISVGYNGFPRGVADDARLDDRLKKYAIIVHAEENAILNAARTGARLSGATCFITYPPCAGCSRMLIQVGIREIVAPAVTIPERWRENMEAAQAILNEAGVRTRVHHA